MPLGTTRVPRRRLLISRIMLPSVSAYQLDFPAAWPQIHFPCHFVTSRMSSFSSAKSCEHYFQCTHPFTNVTPADKNIVTVTTEWATRFVPDGFSDALRIWECVDSICAGIGLRMHFPKQNPKAWYLYFRQCNIKIYFSGDGGMQHDYTWLCKGLRRIGGIADSNIALELTYVETKYFYPPVTF